MGGPPATDGAPRRAAMSSARAMFSEILSFPNPVNEKAARTVALVVMLLACVTLATSWYWLLVPLAYGFIARVLTGPTLSPLGRLASRVVAPRLGAEKPVPGPPKRFAQAIGATLTTVAAVAALGFAAHAVAFQRRHLPRRGDAGRLDPDRDHSGAAGAGRAQRAAVLIARRARSRGPAGARSEIGARA